MGNQACEWKKTTIGEHADIRTGFPFRSQHYTEDSSGIRLLRGDNIVQGDLRWDGVKRWPQKHSKDFEKYFLQSGDVVLAMDRPWIEAGLKYACITTLDLPCLLVQRVARIRGTNTLLTNYLRYVIGHHAFADYVKGIWTGVAVPHISESQIRAFTFLLPPTKTQRKIALILSSYDDLIENNTRRINILQKMTEMIYREWFSNFRFPGHEKANLVTTRNLSIPAGWSFQSVEDIVVRVRSGNKYEQKTVAPYGQVPVLDQGKTGIIGYHNDAPGVQASFADPIITFANHTCHQRLVLFPFSAIQNVLPFRSNPEHNRDIFWLHWATKDLIQFNDYKGHWPEFMNKQVLVPAAEIASAFGDVAKHMAYACHVLEKQNQNLRKTRDVLLPRLISGEIDVEHLRAETASQSS
jgi:type I restriction enzyme, S subunit